MTSRRRQQNMEKENKKTLMDESVDDMLANVDQFIQDVYRDLSISTPQGTLENSSTFLARRSINEDSSVSSTNTSPDEAVSLADASYVNESTSVVSPTTPRNMDAEIERINQICDNVNQNLRSIGLYMNNSSDRSTSEDILSSNLTSAPSSTTSYVLSHDSSPLSTTVRNNDLQTGRQRRRSSSTGSEPANFIDLSVSQTQTPEVLGQPVQQNIVHLDDDDDVILVSANINPVVDLCTPGGHQEASKPRSSINQRQLNRRRLSQQVDDESCCQGPTSTRRRRTEYFTPPEHANTSSESSNVDTPPSATVASGHTPFMCPVCMESCLQRQPTSTRCGHVFCKKCIEHAIRVTHKCPLCNLKISNNQIFRIYL